MKIANETISKLTVQELIDLDGKVLGYDILSTELRNEVATDICENLPVFKEKSNFIVVNDKHNVYRLKDDNNNSTTHYYVIFTKDDECVFRMYNTELDEYFSIGDIVAKLCNTMFDIFMDACNKYKNEG